MLNYIPLVPFPLQRLHLGGAYRLTDDGLLALLAAARDLCALSVPQASRLTGRLVEALPSCALRLVDLNLQDCRWVSQRAPLLY